MTAVGANLDAVHMGYSDSIEVMQKLSVVGALSQRHRNELTNNVIRSHEISLYWRCLKISASIGYAVTRTQQYVYYRRPRTTTIVVP
jgi:hypothetical protein